MAIASIKMMPKSPKPNGASSLRSDQSSQPEARPEHLENVPTPPTLRTLLDLPVFREAIVLSGRSQLNKPVTWIHSAEILDVWRFLTGGELLLSTGLELAHASPAVRVSYIRRLEKAGVRALALELVQWIKEVPAEVIAVAQELNFPILVFRNEVSFLELTRAGHQEILLPSRHHGQESMMDVLIYALIETGRDRSFVRSALGPLLALPERPRKTLLATLEVLLEVNLNMTVAARRLGIRRQTIYYRLDQLKAILGSLDDPFGQRGFLVAFALLRRQDPKPPQE